MQVRRFIGEDIFQMQDWYLNRGLECPPIQAIPRDGFICDGIAAGFLYVTEGKQIGLLEGYITSDKATYSDRQQGLDLVTKALIEEAKQQNISKILAFTTAQVIYDRAIDNGFHYIDNFHCLAKSLNKAG